MSAELKVPPEFDTAPKEQRIAFVQELWDRIAQDPERVPMPPEHQRLLEERLTEYRANPRSGRLWSEVREQLLAKFRGS
jgi:putative addiction module component (TIGR02574 family)